MATNKNAQLRYKILDESFSNFGVKYSYEDLLKRLNEVLDEYGYKVNLRQLQYDIQYMKSYYGIELIEGKKIDDFTKRNKKTFRYPNKEMSIYVKPITEVEKDQLKECLYTLNRIKGLPQLEWVQDMIMKIDSSFNFNENKDSVIGFDENIDLHNKNFISDLYYKIINTRPISILYNTGFENEDKLICHPYFLKQYNNRWFLLGKCIEHDIQISVLPLDRIIEFEEINIEFIKTDIDFIEYFDDLIGVSVQEKTSEIVKLRVSDKQLNYIKTKPIHNSQKYEFDSVGNKLVVLNLKINFELENHILQYGETVQVIEPTDLRDRLYERVCSLKNAYGSIINP